ncbi:MAG: primase-helicase family protein [Solidesulfovibrio sp.]|uniref:primase-helicase family protein n=1 Tax=Solidesulfovibrio sp. TaxID=2910990 RepID=UPI0031581E06
MGSLHTLVEIGKARAGKDAKKPIAPWTEEQKQKFKELFKDSEPACIVASRTMTDYGDNPNIDFNKLVTMVKVPYYKVLGFPVEAAIECESDWLSIFEGSASYDTVKKRTQHFKEQWSFDGAFSCAVNRSYIKGVDCSGCPFNEHVEDYTPLKNVYGSVEEGIQDINRLHSHVIIGKDTYVLKINPPSDKGDNVTFMKLQAFRDWYPEVVANTGKVDNDGKPIYTGLAPIWLRSKDRRKYDGVGFYPYPVVTPPNYFNMFRGLKAARMNSVPGASCGRYLEHVHDVICSGNERIYNYVLAWLAHLIQQPGDDKPGTAIAIRGPQGSGKGTFTRWIQSVIGPAHSMKISTEERLIGKFNHHLMDKIFVNADECVWSGNRKVAGVLKALITESPLDFEQKGINAVSVDSYTRVVFTSNERWMVPADADDRRFVVLDCATTHVKDMTYYRSIMDDMKNGGVVELYNFLLHYDYESVDIHQAPSTRALILQKLQTLTSVDRWWYTVLSRGSFSSHDGVMECVEEGEPQTGWPVNPEFKVTQDLYSSYKESLKGSGKRVEDDETFGSRLKDLTGVTPSRRSIQGQRRRRGFALPSLPECRAAFTRFMHSTEEDMDWPEA